MRTPTRPVPEAVVRWTSRARWLRALDATLAWLACWAVLALALETLSAAGTAVLAIVLVVAAGLLPFVRARWRPASAVVGVVLAWPLRAGDHAWYVRPERAEAVLVTARRGLRIVIARPGETREEGIAVRPTRVLLVPGLAFGRGT